MQRLKTRNLFFEVLLSSIEIDRIIQMAWEDRTPFEAIKYQFNITEKEVIRLMKKEMTEKKLFFS